MITLAGFIRSLAEFTVTVRTEWATVWIDKNPIAVAKI